MIKIPKLSKISYSLDFVKSPIILNILRKYPDLRDKTLNFLKFLILEKKFLDLQKSLSPGEKTADFQKSPISNNPEFPR